MPQRIAIISDHASPLAPVGGVDSGGQNIYVAETARYLAARGHLVDVFTRKDHPDLPEVAEWLPGVRVVHVPAGPAAFVRKEDVLPWIPEFTAFVERFAAR
ncbi:MAG: phosphoheptose isomerase, partial [Lysobacterales bacterium]